MAAMRSWCIIETARGDWGGLAPVRVHDAAAAVSVHRGAVYVLKGNMISAACGTSAAAHNQTMSTSIDFLLAM